MSKKILREDSRERLKIEVVPDITLQELIEQLNLPVTVSALCYTILHKLKITRNFEIAIMRIGIDSKAFIFA